MLIRYPNNKCIRPMHSNDKKLSLSTSVLDLAQVYIHLVMRVFIIYCSLMSVRRFTSGAAKKQKKNKKRRSFKKIANKNTKCFKDQTPHLLLTVYSEAMFIIKSVK